MASLIQRLSKDGRELIAGDPSEQLIMLLRYGRNRAGARRRGRD